jgi:hypothetical protein
MAFSTAEGRSAASAIARLDWRTCCRDPEGAAITTLCPRASSSLESRQTYSFTSWRDPHGCGATCAIVNPSPAAIARSIRVAMKFAARQVLATITGGGN